VTGAAAVYPDTPGHRLHTADGPRRLLEGPPQPAQDVEEARHAGVVLPVPTIHGAHLGQYLALPTRDTDPTGKLPLVSQTAQRNRFPEEVRLRQHQATTLTRLRESQTRE
jgi:hypothetical protein